MANINALKKITDRLSAAQIDFVIGGSGLAYLLGLKVEANDWDIMTDASKLSVETCLADFKLTQKDHRPPFCSKFLLSLQSEGHEIEIIGGFALKLNGTLHQFPARGTLVRQGLPLADVDMWIKIYELLGNNDKAEVLRNWKKQEKL